MRPPSFWLLNSKMAVSRFIASGCRLCSFRTLHNKLYIVDSRIASDESEQPDALLSQGDMV